MIVSRLRPVFVAVVVCCCAVFAEDVAPRILDGTPHPVADFPTVGLITDADNTFLASGTLIGPRHVLTAGHCCTDASGAKLPDTAGRFLIGGAFHNTSRILLHPSFNSQLLGEDNIVDLGIFELDAPIAITPSPLQRSPVTAGSKLTIVGYGKLGTGKRGILNIFPEPGTLTSGTVTIGEVTPINLSWVFTAGESATAPGDSGGPSFPEGSNAVAGVHSLGISISGRNFGKFGTINKDARVDTAIGWIDSILTGTSSNNAPTVTTAASANPTTLQAGGTVNFSVAATDPDGNPLVYIWDFGDGDAAVGATQTHTYLFPGSYNATVTISDGIAAVVAPTPVIVDASLTAALDVKKCQLTVNFTRESQDAASLSGTLSPLLTAVEGFAKIDIGGAVAYFAVDSRGRGLGPQGKITINLKKGAYSISLRQGDFAANWVNEGITNMTGTAPVMMPITLAVNGSVYSTTRGLTYTGKQGRGGKAK